MSNTVLLNGKHVSPDTIDPGKHRYLGLFRPPADPFASAKGDCICNCGEIIRYVGGTREHYKNGCWDIPQYIDID